MHTFALINGDIALGTGGYQMVTGAAKLQQDMGVTMTEPFQCDRFHPQWGSVLGTYIGNPVAQTVQMLVQTEISRLIQNYMRLQNSTMLTDAGLGRKARFGPGEVISRVTGIQVRQDYDRYYIKVSLSTLSGEAITLFQTVQG